MQNRLLTGIKGITKKHRKLFCAFLTLGYPSLKATEHLAEAFEKSGVDILELGFPFSDPLADGPTIQYSSEYALEKGVQLEDAFELVHRLRQKGVKIPIIFFTYINPVFHYGLKRFVTRARQSGFDGLIIPDLPPEEEKGLQRECHRQNFPQIYLVTPTTGKKRAAFLAQKSQGFIYYVSLKGVTGARKALPSDLKRQLQEFRRLAHKPFLVGFGVSTPAQAKALSRDSDGVIVGSALIQCLRQSNGNLGKVTRFVRQMVRAVKDHS